MCKTADINTYFTPRQWTNINHISEKNLVLMLLDYFFLSNNFDELMIIVFVYSSSNNFHFVWTNLIITLNFI